MPIASATIMAKIRELDRDRQLAENELENRDVGAQRDAEIALQHLSEPGDVLDRHRIVETILLAQKCEHLRIALLAGHREDGIAGQELAARRTPGPTR